MIDRACFKKENVADNIKYRHLGKLYRRSADNRGDENSDLCL
jgi:hypothetical protein